MSFQLGDKVRVAVKFSDLTRTNADPDLVRLRMRAPDGTQSSLVYGASAEVVRDQTGEYHDDVALLSPGEWWFRWEGVGALVAAVEQSLQVEDSQFETANVGSHGAAHAVQANPSSAPTLTVSATGVASMSFSGAPASAPTITAGAVGASLFAAAPAAAPLTQCIATGAALFKAAPSSSPVALIAGTGAALAAGAPSAAPSILADSRGASLVAGAPSAAPSLLVDAHAAGFTPVTLGDGTTAVTLSDGTTAVTLSH